MRIKFLLNSFMVCSFWCLSLNAFSQGGTLPLDGSVNGTFAVNTADTWQITTNGDGLLQFTITDNDPNNYVVAGLYDLDGTTVISNYATASPGNPAVVNTDGLAAGTYYIKVSPYSTGQSAAYTLADTLIHAPVSNDMEPNSNTATALTLALNGTTTGHFGYYYNNYRDSTDWYKITTTSDGLLRVTLTDYATTANNLVNFIVLDKDGVTPVSNGTTSTVATPGVATIDGLAAGTYYVVIYPYTTGQFAPYKLSDSLFTYQYSADTAAEPNGLPYLAKTIAANRTITGHFGFYYNHLRDTTDWWKINYTGTSGDLNLTINLLPHLSDGVKDNAYFYVFKDTSSAPVYQAALASTSNAVNLTSLSQGYYFIAITQYNPYEFEAYSITDSFTQVNKATISLLKAASSVNSCGSDSLVYKLAASHSPYTVMFYRDNVLFDSVTTATDTARFTGLNDGNYYAKVYGDGATDSAYSKTGNTQFLPPTPSGLTTTNVGAHTATFNFTTLNCVQGFTVQYKAAGSSSYTTIITDSNGVYTLSGLSPSTMYTWRIASVDSTNGLTSSYSDTANFTTLSALPVTFLNFDGALINSNAQLTWSTATELNNSGFEVQKSSDGQSFNGIGFVKGQVNSSILNTYNYTDVKVVSGNNYYRLKQIDINGKFNYSSIVRLDFKNFNWSIFGNPVTGNSWIQLEIARTSNIAIQVLSIDGKILKAINKGNISEGTYSIPLNLGDAPSGIYIVRLTADNKTFSKKIIK